VTLLIFPPPLTHITALQQNTSLCHNCGQTRYFCELKKENVIDQCWNNKWSGLKGERRHLSQARRKRRPKLPKNGNRAFSDIHIQPIS
jgi:hypothetical protein